MCMHVYTMFMCAVQAQAGLSVLGVSVRQASVRTHHLAPL
jgi:hypothetical protein